jgi:predicted nuclease of predicted toxin-antitoxin system
MDVHIPAAITEGLRRRLIDVVTSQEDGTREKSDQNLLQRATELGRVFFSQDQDLLQIAHQWQEETRSFAGLIFSPQNVSIGRLVSDLELIAHCCTKKELSNCVFYLPLH